MEQGDFAMRGSIVDLYPPGEETAIQIDFFGETLETIRVFEPERSAQSGQSGRNKPLSGQRN